MRHVYFLTGIMALFFMLQSCPVRSSIPESYEETLERVIYWSAEFGYNCALADVSREEMHRLLRERKEKD